MRYNERIRELREDRSLKQKEIAELLNIGQRTYSDYESGKTRIPLDSIMVLARFYDVSMDYITGASDKYAKRTGIHFGMTGSLLSFFILYFFQCYLRLYDCATTVPAASTMTDIATRVHVSDPYSVRAVPFQSSVSASSSVDVSPGS